MVTESKLGCIVQARMSSTRLPGKVLMRLEDKSVLGHILTRLKQLNQTNVIIVATSNLQEDDAIEQECINYDILCFRGSLRNVLSRYYEAATFYKLTDIVRICADNAILDWNFIDKQITEYYKRKPDILCCGNKVTLGVGGEMFSYNMLKTAYKNATEEYQYEHVTPYIYENSSNIVRYNIEEDLSRYRFTLDTIEDWQLVKKIYSCLYKKNNLFTLADAISFMNNNPELYQINKNVKQNVILRVNEENKYVKA